jgi:hypothetical protein
MLRQLPRVLPLCSRGYAKLLKGERGTSQNPLRIGLIPADGIGNEVIPVSKSQLAIAISYHSYLGSTKSS